MLSLYGMIVTIPGGLTKQSTFYMDSDRMKNKVVPSPPIPSKLQLDRGKLIGMFPWRDFIQLNVYSDSHFWAAN